MTKKLKLGFIGGGINSAVGRTHKIAAEMDSRFELVCGAFSRHSDINIKTGQEYGIAEERIYDSWLSLLQTEKGIIDAVVVLTPTPTHTAIVIKAIEMGFAVICEKSLTNNRADGEKIRQTIEQQKGFLVVTYNYTGYPMVREMRAMIQDDLLGQIQQIHIEMPQEGFLRLTTDGKAQIPQQWRLKDEEIPTVSLDLGVHLHNIIQFLTSEKPFQLVAKQNNFGNFKGIIDNVVCIAEYSNNITCHFWYGKTALGQSNGLKIRIFGNKGSVEWLQLHPEELFFNDNIGNRHKIDKGASSLKVASHDRYSRFKAGHPAGFIEAFANYYCDIADALHSKNNTLESEYIFTADDACDSLTITAAMNESEITKSWIKL
jgi:predicted dehydrogenase